MIVIMPQWLSDHQLVYAFAHHKKMCFILSVLAFFSHSFLIYLYLQGEHISGKWVADQHQMMKSVMPWDGFFQVIDRQGSCTESKQGEREREREREVVKRKEKKRKEKKQGRGEGLCVGRANNNM